LFGERDLMKLSQQIFNLLWYAHERVFPMCPQGGHRQKGKLVTNKLGNKFCLHHDCVAANFKEIMENINGRNER